MVALLSEHLPATIAIVLGIVSLIAAGIFALRVLRLPSGNEEMVRISGAIRVGAMAYLKRQFSVISIIAFIIFLLLGFLMKDTGWYLAIAFLVGAACSGLAAYVGMATASRANVRTAEASRHGLARGLAVAVSGGAVNGLFVVGLSLIGVSAFYLIFLSALGNAPELLHGSSALTVAPELLIGFGFGASLVSLFARVGGGIFTKAADVGADLVGKIEKDIPEDDARNPAVIAANLGAMVGDSAGLGGDHLEP